MNAMMIPRGVALARVDEAPKLQLPLRRDHFKRLRLTKADVQNYISIAKSLLDEALNKQKEVLKPGKEIWKQLGSHAGFRRFTQCGDDGKDIHYRLQGTIHASLNDLMGIMYADSTSQAVERRKILYGDSLDAITLCVLKQRNAEHMQEHISIRWQAVNLSNSCPTFQRDMCNLEYTGVATDADGIPFGFKIMHSIERSECISLKESHGLTRLNMTEFMLLRPTQDAIHTDIILDGVAWKAEKLPEWLVTSFLNNVSTCLSKLPIIVQEKQLAKLPIVSDWQFVPLSSRKNCHVCLNKFGLLSKKVNCRSCGEVACKSCIVTRTLEKTTKVCTKCILMVSNHYDCTLPCSERSYVASSPAAYRSGRGSETSSSKSPSIGGKGDGLLVSRMRVDSNLQVDTSRTTSRTTSDASFDSLDSNLTNRRPRYSSHEEEVEFTLDTAQMVRSNRLFSPSVVPNGGRIVPSVENVEDSIAQQRYILQEMMLQAKAYEKQQMRV